MRSTNGLSMKATGHYHGGHGEPATQPLEAKSIPPELASTLEHIVGQLDILTQVRYSNGCMYGKIEGGLLI